MTGFKTVMIFTFNAFNKWCHKAVGGTGNDEVLDRLHKIKVYLVKIGSQKNQVKEIDRVGRLSVILGYPLKHESRVLTKEEAYQPLGSWRLFRLAPPEMHEACIHDDNFCGDP